MHSIIKGDDEYCYIHKRFYDVEVPAQYKHHCLHGFNRRWLADQDGLTVNLCMMCHIRLHDSGIYDLELEQIAERAWIEHNNKTVDDFIKRYGKNYL